jgi:hypothetical protein
MDITGPEYWQAVVRTANTDLALGAKAMHLEALTVTFQIGETHRIIEFHRGRVGLLPAAPLRGTTLRITGPPDEWRRLVSGEIPYAMAVNVVHGRLHLQGDIIAAAWATPALWELFRAAIHVYEKDVTHG